jgi:hypothetical protein
MHWFDFREQTSAWTHCVWLLLSFPATVVLWRRSRGSAHCGFHHTYRRGGGRGSRCQRLKDVGVDLIDDSSGGMTPKARIPVGKGYQVPFARRIRAETGIRTGAVGLITEPRHAKEIITGGDADLVFLVRELLREPYWALNAQHDLGGQPSWPIQYGYAIKRRAK